MARTFAQDLMRVADLPAEASQFDLLQVPDTDVVRMIQAAGGVQSIQVDMSIDAAAADLLAAQARPPATFGRIKESMSELVRSLAMAPRGGRIVDSNHGRVRLQISVPDGDLAQAKDAASAIAADIVEDEDADDYVLYLRNGEQIRRNAMAVRKLVPLERSANSFDPADVRRAMLLYLGELRQSGQLEV